MKSLKKHFFVSTLVISALLFIASCATTIPAKPAQAAKTAAAAAASTEKKVKIAENAESVAGSITAADKFGNLATDVKKSALQAANIKIGDIAAVDICGKIIAVPVVTSYSDVDVGSFLVRIKDDAVYLSINHGNCAEKTGAKEGTPITFILSKSEGYLSEFTIRHLEKSENRSDYASDEIFANARGVSTKGIKANTLYRSCNPSLSDARAPYADAFAKKSGIRTAINLANNETVYNENQAKLPAEYYSTLVKNGNVIFLDMGVTITDLDFSEKLAEGLRFMIKHDGPYLVHCDEGKDRAGFVNALLEAVMGASVKEIEADYMKSFENYFNVKDGSEQYNHISGNIIGMFESVNGGEKVTDSNIQKVAKNYVVNTLGLSSGEVKQLQAKLK